MSSKRSCKIPFLLRLTNFHTNLPCVPTLQPSTICSWIRLNNVLSLRLSQLIWANTRKVGCGFKKCSKSRMPFGYSVVCNYGPAGNFIGEFPYETSEEAHDFNQS
ncbi:uncharacterized protein DEA37_0013665 [Paragonimus westermani]|uniref:SCP domain-containing protein n=1 Tax=Paragonimus westermani TaxID=34504 RepID=A0A5J4NVQ8_9TREM|nr:uncharacterized protein DEA37_0013665 [Paragonimus westermani]